MMMGSEHNLDDDLLSVLRLCSAGAAAGTQLHVQGELAEIVPYWGDSALTMVALLHARAWLALLVQQACALRHSLFSTAEQH